MTTADTITRLRAALVNATPGEWLGCHDGNCVCGSIYAIEHGFVLARVNLNHEENIFQNIPKEVYTANAKFITLAHNDLPALLDAYDALQAENARLWAFVENVANNEVLFDDLHTSEYPFETQAAMQRIVALAKEDMVKAQALLDTRTAKTEQK